MANWLGLVWRYCHDTYHRCYDCDFTYLQFEAWLRRNKIEESPHRAERALRQLAAQGYLTRELVTRPATRRRTTLFRTTDRACLNYREWAEMYDRLVAERGRGQG